MAVEIPVDLQPELVPLAWLIGTWEGHGVVTYTDVDEQRIFQRAEFSMEGRQPYLLYTCRTWLEEESDASLLGVETGIWQLARPRGDFDTGPGLMPPTAASPYSGADAVEALRTERKDFDIEVALSYPHGLMEHYAGRIAGPRVDLVSDGGVKTPNALEYHASSRMYGLVDGHLMWVWEMAANGQDAAAHVSADLQRTTPSVLG